MIYALDTETYKTTKKGLEPELDCNNFTLGIIIDEKGNKNYFYTPQQMYDFIKQ